MLLSCPLTLSQLLAQQDCLPAIAPTGGDGLDVDHQWRAAVTALNHLLRSPSRAQSAVAGLMICAPTPVLSDGGSGEDFKTWMIHSPGGDRLGQSQACLPGASSTVSKKATAARGLSLAADDPLTQEQFALILTAEWSLVMVRGWGEGGEPLFQYSFEPELVTAAWQLLRDRLQGDEPLAEIERQWQRYPPVEPHYKMVMRFGQMLFYSATTDRQSSGASSPHGKWASFRTNFCVDVPSKAVFETPFNPQPSEAPDVELLRAMAHEVRTPLTTIRTFTKLILKRPDIPQGVRPWLEQIDRECSEQIGRFELIFKAVELETGERSPSPMHLTATSLADVVDSCIPRWQKQASRRSLKLDVLLPQQMPQVVSDPNLLDRVLTGAIDHFTCRLPVGSHIQVKVMPAGHQLKLQLKANSDSKQTPNVHTAPSFKSIGQLLNVQPETGNISLNLSATKNLFQALGGKLIVRHRPQQGEILTIFLPLN
ncbi:HAMP domain-containing histidine kinase [Phormidium yuhuli AB48]|uniref:histidine kinase n=1 Tax=Phormidium yuhuli AB48 TaxID=2940671 RepID=A0ABY5AQP6_9CYAN|nr:HAMP domain-containing sensor histidine kinase [Phormidium yuhuli]USR91231.1 HAMP domain-containing histidine kinase [Phormidium yuhuli AB48]